MSCMLIPKEDALFKTKHKPKVNIQLHWISLFSKSSWIKTTASGLSYELGVNGENKLMETGLLLIKMDKIGSTFHTAKPGNFNSLREVIWIMLWNCYLEIDWRWESVPKTSTETPFCICLWSNKQVLSKFYYLLIFSPCSNQMK